MTSTINRDRHELRRYCSAAIGMLVWVGVACAEPPLIESFRSDLKPAEIAQGEALHARSIATQAYLYQFPAFLHMRQIGEFIQGREYSAPGETPLGGWVYMRTLATPKTDNVLPNVDTLYAASYVWLAKQGPVVVSVPEMGDRYYSVGLYDSWFSVFDIIGTSTNGGRAGHYLIVPPGWEGDRPEGIERVIVAPTPVICIYQRIYLGLNEDTSVVRALQDQVRLAPVATWRQPRPSFPPLDDSVFRTSGVRQTRDPLRYFELVSAYTALTPPPVSERFVTGLFSLAGVGPGSRLPQAQHLRTAISDGAADAQRIMNASISHGPFRNGWSVPNPAAAKSGPDTLARAVAQMTQIGLLPAEEAIYFFGLRDNAGQPLDGRKAYRLTFAKGQLPPVEAKGFWSLTMYNERSLLADNPIDRYSIRPDSPGLTRGEDGSLTIYLQHQQPAGVPIGNWLPTPAGRFSLALRTYLPKPTVRTGEWFAPGAVAQGR